jgi:hypothetical protein
MADAFDALTGGNSRARRRRFPPRSSAPLRARLGLVGLGLVCGLLISAGAIVDGGQRDGRGPHPLRPLAVP